MRRLLLLAFLAISACSSGDPDGDRNRRYDRRLFPVDPHFVVSILDVHQAPNVVDTQYVFVGKLVDTQDPRFDLRAEAADTLGWIYRRVRLPWMFSTVVQTAQVLRARLRYDNAATVTLTGPFGGAQRAIALRPLGHGFYYFRSAEHPLVGEADYTLDVLTGSGVRLRSTMRTPGPFVWPLPARHDIRVRKYVHEGRV